MTTLRLRRSDVLRLPPEFQLCFTQGQRVNGRYFRLHVLPAAKPRLGLAVSRKVDPRAVARNRIKRTAREAFRTSREAIPCADLVLVAKREAAAASNAELRYDLAQLWRRARTLKPLPPTGTMRDAAEPPPAARGEA
jgi:ribonuclease P protein component